MERLTLREVFGVEGRTFNRGQVAMLVAAFLISDLVFWLVLIRGLPGLFVWVFVTANLISLLVLAILLFRFISSIPVVLVLSAVCHAPFRLAFLHFVYGIPDEEVERYGLSTVMIGEVLEWLILLGVLALALRLIRRPGVALVAGAIVGGLALRATWIILLPDAGVRLDALLADLVQGADGVPFAVEGGWLRAFRD